jgi:hypothetical protein
MCSTGAKLPLEQTLRDPPVRRASHTHTVTTVVVDKACSPVEPGEVNAFQSARITMSLLTHQCME